MTIDDLKTFELEVAERFNRSEIRFPIHLSGGNEAWLIDYFARHYNAARGDWVCTYWRSHYHALLAGVPPEKVMGAILAGRSITLCFPEHRVVSSAIVGGVLPIALGLALSAKRRGTPERVHCFAGDMTARTGAFYESINYAHGHGLPVRFIVEDNGKSVMTDTHEAWGTPTRYLIPDLPNIGYYNYALPWPHAGAGIRVEF